jgi:hypothetical protein
VEGQLPFLAAPSALDLERRTLLCQVLQLRALLIQRLLADRLPPCLRVVLRVAHTETTLDHHRRVLHLYLVRCLVLQAMLIRRAPLLTPPVPLNQSCRHLLSHVLLARFHPAQIVSTEASLHGCRRSLLVQVGHNLLAAVMLQQS